MTTNNATSAAKSQRHNHIVTIQPATSHAGGGDDGFREDFLKALHALEIRVVKLEQLVKFGGFIFAVLQFALTTYLGMKGH